MIGVEASHPAPQPTGTPAAPVRAEFLPIAVPDMGPRERELVLEALDSGWITTGPRAFELARRIADMAGAKHGLAVNSATALKRSAITAMASDAGANTSPPRCGTATTTPSGCSCARPSQKLRSKK